MAREADEVDRADSSRATAHGGVPSARGHGTWSRPAVTAAVAVIGLGVITGMLLAVALSLAAGAYVLASVTVCIVAAWIGLRLTGN